MPSLTAFTNELYADFRQEENASAMRAALAKVRAQSGREYDLIIGGKRSRTRGKITSSNPAHPSEVVGIHQKAGPEHVEPAMQAALAAFASWKNTSAEQRAKLAFRTAAILRERKFEFNAWIVVEAGKNWDEAEAETCEAIDFCELYARSARQLDAAEPVVQLPGERDQLR
jgi:1-pyrroline-5-carboxylate dehydrogenase